MRPVNAYIRNYATKRSRKKVTVKSFPSLVSCARTYHCSPQSIATRIENGQAIQRGLRVITFDEPISIEKD